VLKQLGLTLSTSQYVLVGIQMFLTLLIVLSISLMLGVLAKDAKSAQTLTMPILAVTIIPFIVTMLFDVQGLSPVLRYAVYAIPFTHSFAASQNMMFGNTELFTFGLIYQFVFLLICLGLALRIFLSDRIFTMTENSGGLFRKKKQAAHED
jgi:ABC-2 type transport system permease protein